MATPPTASVEALWIYIYIYIYVWNWTLRSVYVQAGEHTRSWACIVALRGCALRPGCARTVASCPEEVQYAQQLKHRVCALRTCRARPCALLAHALLPQGELADLAGQGLHLACLGHSCKDIANLFSKGLVFGPWGLTNRPRGPEGREKPTLRPLRCYSRPASATCASVCAPLGRSGVAGPTYLSASRWGQDKQGHHRSAAISQNQRSWLHVWYLLQHVSYLWHIYGVCGKLCVFRKTWQRVWYLWHFRKTEEKTICPDPIWKPLTMALWCSRRPA